MNYDLDRIKKDFKITDILTSLYGYKLTNNKMCCPFHSEKKPSFSVKVDDNTFKCFGCQESGSVIDLVMKLSNVTLQEACSILTNNNPIYTTEDNYINKNDNYSKEYNEPINTQKNIIEHKQEKEVKENKQDIYDIYKEVYDYFIEPTREDVRFDFMNSRGIKLGALKETKTRFTDRLGELEIYLKNKYTDEILIKSGLFTTNMYFLISNYHFCFPFFKNNNIVGFQFRNMATKESPEKEYQHRYLNVGENVTFFNSQLLVNVLQDSAYNEIKKNEKIYITEGILDCLSLISFQYNAISLRGVGTLKKEWVKFLKELNVCFVFDNDDAGKKIITYDEKEKNTRKVNYAQWWKEQNKTFFFVDWRKLENDEIKDVNDFFMSNIINKRDVFNSLISEQQFHGYDHIGLEFEVKDYMEKLVSSNAISEFNTNKKNFNEIYPPIRGELYAIIGKSGAGKTRWAIDLLENWLNNGKKILFIENEFDRKVIIMNLLARFIRTNWRELLKVEFYNYITDETKKEISKFWKWYREKENLLFIKNNITDVTPIFDNINKFKPDVIFLDTLQDLRPNSNENMVNFINNTAVDFKNYCVTNNVLMCVLCQPADNMEGEPKTMYSRGAKGFTDKCDIVDFIYDEWVDTKEKKGQKNTISLHRMKGRSVGQNKIILGYNRLTGYFHDVFVSN